MSEENLNDDLRSIAIGNDVPAQIINDREVGIFTLLGHPEQKPALARAIAYSANRYIESTDDVDRVGSLADMYRSFLDLIELEGLNLEHIKMVARHLNERDGTHTDHIGLVGFVPKPKIDTSEA